MHVKEGKRSTIYAFKKNVMSVSKNIERKIVCAHITYTTFCLVDLIYIQKKHEKKKYFYILNKHNVYKITMNFF